MLKARTKAIGPSGCWGSSITGPEFISNLQNGPDTLLGSITGPEFISNQPNGPDNLANGPSVRLTKQTVGDEDLRLYQQLYGYATQGKIDSFIDTIDRKLGANARDWLLSRLNPHNNTLLHIAAKFGHAKLAAEILQHHKPLLFETNSDRDTALHVAAKAGDLDTTNTLLHEAQGRDVFILLTSINNEKNTPLHEALIHGHQSVAKCLIEAYPVLRFDCNKEQKSTLYLAAEEGFAEIVKLIRKKAFQQNIRVHVHGKSPLHGAILGRRNKELLEVISSMEETFQSPKDEKDRTPLHCAASIGYMEGVRFLLERHLSDSHQVDHRGNFPIHSASSKGHVKIVKELLRHCPDSTEYRNYNFENILHVAARCGKDNVVKYFLKNGEFQMLINQKDSNGNTPLHLATKHHHPKVVYRLAWDTRTNLNLLNGMGETALDITESNFGTIDSYRGSLTWTILKSAFTQPAQSLHVHQWWRSPQVADNGGYHHEERFNDKVNAQSLHVQSRKKISPKVAASGGDHHEERFKDRVNALLVVATLVATVAFAAGFTMPGGNNDSAPHEGMSILLTKAMFQTFVICNTIAMYTATLVAVTLIWAQLEDVNLVYNALRLALPLLWIALTMMSLAFMAGVYVVVSNLHWLANVVLILGVLFIFTVLVVFTPLYCKTTSRFYILRCITYFLFCVEVWASTSHNKDQTEE
ncbi:PREDICTED: protein ACCELERATED CELL DEATH 6-like isoform X2 [Prunus mume]|uniref:Protein ACCELERATED CELL DEATH 6-like isoform X2 n=1 Tax=Prunus mume TaxID=102107 RepID=A0ABM0PVA1_PRUMU|nr:PREDICTED: protein ACCELERATED CELL DEATH 6-like isoform X2 [Prunus mume]